MRYMVLNFDYLLCGSFVLKLCYVAVAGIDVFVDFLAVVVNTGFVVADGMFAP